MPDDKQIQKLNTLKTIAETLNQANDLKQMLQDVLKELLHVTGLQTGWIFLIKENGEYELAADCKLPPALMRKGKKPMCEGDCWCISRYLEGRLERAANIIECKRLENAIKFNWGSTNHITHHATVPLRAGNEKFGILNVASPNKEHFTIEELALLEAVAYQIGTAIKRILLVENEQKLALIAERNRFARDLHDSVNQLLFSLLLTVRGTREMSNEPDVQEMLAYIQDLAQESLSEMKSLIWQLRPQGLEKGLGSALIQYGKVLGLDVELEVNGVVDLPSKVEEGLWRIGQEALNNCKKHAGTNQVKISLNEANTSISLVVEDKGVGFQYDENVGIPSLGLGSMKERAKQLNGYCRINSSPSEGTTITIKVPISKI